ncbi:MAG: tetratricopeptide repeat protein [Crocinitomicaceae bacterium]|nr:tetratricopeptide repeat protein [Crocinitomicaceae bacterium]
MYFKTHLFLIILISSCSSEYDCKDYSEEDFTYDQEAIALSDKGVEFQIEGNLDSAMHYFKLAAEKDPTYYMPHGNIGRLYIKSGDLELAKTEFEKIVELRPDMAEAHGGLAMFYDYLDLDDKATKEYETAIALYTDRIECSSDENLMESSKIDRALFYMLSGQEEKGKSELEDLKEKFEGDPAMQEMMEDLINLEKESFLKEMYE